MSPVPHAIEHNPFPPRPTDLDLQCPCSAVWSRYLEKKPFLPEEQLDPRQLKPHPGAAGEVRTQ